VAAFLDPSLLKFEDYYVDVETAGELTAGETVGYSPITGDLRRNPDAQKQATLNMSIRGSASTLASSRTSPVLHDKFVPNAKVAVDVDSARFFELLNRAVGEQGIIRPVLKCLRKCDRAFERCDTSLPCHPECSEGSAVFDEPKLQIPRPLPLLGMTSF